MDWMNWKTWTVAALIMIVGFAIYTFAANQPSSDPLTPVDRPTTLRTTAVQDGDGWVLDGQKVWTSYAQFADWGLCLARTNWEVPKHRGLTVFMLPIHQPGVEPGARGRQRRLHRACTREAAVEKVSLRAVVARDRLHAKCHAGDGIGEPRTRGHDRDARLAGDAHDAAHRLHHHVVGGFLRERPRMPEPRRRRVVHRLPSRRHATSSDRGRRAGSASTDRRR